MKTAVTTDTTGAADDAGKDRAEDTSSTSTTADNAQKEATTRPSEPRRVSLSVRTLAASLLMLILVATAAATTWLYFDERNIVQTQNAEAADRAHAEQIAMDYAVNAAAMNYQDLNAWKVKLVNGTTPELHDKLAKAANSMEQLLVPLQWTSTAKPLVAKARSQGNGVYVVDTFVSVVTKTTQAPDNLQSTATYSVTIDSKNGWQITDVGGIGAVVGNK